MTAGPRRKKSDQYHHGDLPRAMVQAAVRTIQKQGIDALTLRGVGDQLGVSRTALYRHFSSKQDLLLAVATEGFRTLRKELSDAWERAGHGRAGFDAMGVAYIQFAVRHPSHYRVMFNGGIRAVAPQHANDTDAFDVLLQAILELQHQWLVRRDDPRLLALYIWSVVHGVAMLALDGMLASPTEPEGNTGHLAALTDLAIARLTTGIR